MIFRASMVSLGENGYNLRAKKIVTTAKMIAKNISLIKGLKVFGDTKAMIVCFGSEEINIYRIGDAMTKLGWSLNSLQNPASIHLCVTMPVINSADRFIEDLTKVVNVLLLSNKENTGKDDSGSAAMYGKAGSLPAGPISELLESYIDITLTP